MEPPFQFLNSDTLGDPMFETGEDVDTILAEAWSRLISELERIRSMVIRGWATITPQFYRFETSQ